MRGKSDQDQMYALLAAKAKLEQQRRVLENKIEDLFLLIRASKYKHPHLKIDIPETRNETESARRPSAAPSDAAHDQSDAARTDFRRRA
jgi:uncharacterized membrane protein YgaE (UPF0421/DUF939 family)